MAYITSADVTITVLKNRILRGSPGGVRVNTVKIQFGDAALGYDATNKIPLPTFPSFGLLKELEFLKIINDGLATVKYHWSYDYVNKRLLAYVLTAAAGGSHSHDLYIPGGSTTATTDLVHAPDGQILNQSTGAITITGKASTTAAATSGGVLAATVLTAGQALAELADNTAIAAQTLYAQAWGW